LDEVFLGMQAMNVDVVDAYLDELEAQLLQEYTEQDRMPVQLALFVGVSSAGVRSLSALFARVVDARPGGT
jgi:hypothetical protein